MAAGYVKETGYHVAYRVTPIFYGDNLLAGSVLMEGYSIENQGDGICFCVFAYNAQPGVVIDYTTGNSQLNDRNSAGSGAGTISLPASPAVSAALPRKRAIPA